MSREGFEVLQGGIIKRKAKRRMAIFIDATGMDRAARRINRKIDLSRLVSVLTSGIKLEIARYYCLIPNEDDARQLSYLDAVERAGLEVITKRLPPKGVKRQVSMDVHIATDLMSYCFGQFEKAEEIAKLVPENATAIQTDDNAKEDSGPHTAQNLRPAQNQSADRTVQRIVTVVCPSRELSYAIYNCRELGVETCLADFGLYGTTDGWRGVDRWIDLSTSETIWR